jgi:hypothetical protein
MEVHHPAWEQDMIRHLMHHLVRRIPEMGPLWAHSMFPFERLWNRVFKWMTATVHPATTIMNAYHDMVR